MAARPLRCCAGILGLYPALVHAHGGEWILAMVLIGGLPGVLAGMITGVWFAGRYLRSLSIMVLLFCVGTTIYLAQLGIGNDVQRFVFDVASCIGVGLLPLLITHLLGYGLVLGLRRLLGRNSDVTDDLV